MARSTRYTQIGERGDAARQQRYELGFQNRYLEREIGTGDMRKRIVETVKAEREAKKLAATHDRLIRQTKLMEAQVKYGRYGGAAAYFYGQNRESIAGAGRMAGGVAMGAAGTAAGLAASGYSGTVEGERFALEMRILSLELAAAFKPFMDGLTNATRAIRKFIQAGGEERQNQILRGGAVFAGGTAGYAVGSRIAGGRGGLIGGAIGAKIGYESPELIEEFQKGEGFASDVTKRFSSVTQSKLGKDIIGQLEDFTSYGPFGQVINAYKKFNKSYKEYMQPEGKAAGEKTPGMVQEEAKKESRKLMLTEGVGFAEAGSTYYDLAETLIRTQAAEANKPIVDKLDELKQEVGKLNK
jgi:hypothetical protein